MATFNSTFNASCSECDWNCTSTNTAYSPNGLDLSNSTLNSTYSECDSNCTSTNSTNCPNNWDLSRYCRLVFCDGTRNEALLSNCKSMYFNIFQEVQHEEDVQQRLSLMSQVLLTLMLSVILLLSIVGNTLVILTFIVNRHMRSVTNVFILSIAINDLMVTLTCIPIDIGTELTTYWVFGTFGCELLPCIMSFSIACSSLTLCCIAFDRYYAIVHPLKLKLIQTPQRAVILLVIVWVVSFVSSVPYVMFYETIELKACVGYQDGRKPEHICYAPYYPGVKKIFDVWITVIVQFVIPFFVMTGMYAVICHKLWFQGPVGTGTMSHQDFRIRLKKRVVKMLIVVVLLFVVCWSPILLFNALATTLVLQINETNINWRAYLQCLALSSTCWNPLVYAFMNEKFRKSFKTLLTCRNSRVYPIVIRNTAMRMSTESRRTTTQLEVPCASGSAQTTETKI